MDDGLCVWVEEAERRGRGAGEGRLYVTQQRVYFWANNAAAPSWWFARSEITKVSDNWIIAPGMRQLTVTCGAGPVNFYAGKHLVRRLRQSLQP